jgi:hypothetical protein
MQSKVIWSFLSLAALAVGGLAAGCDSDAKVARSAEGESCTKTSDCDDGLRCLQSVCYRAASDNNNNNEGGESNGSAGSSPIGPTPPVLGGPGESCTKRADCEDGLGCFNQRCEEMGAGAGGAGNVGPTLGGPGETCSLTSDCAEGTRCLPQTPQFETLSLGGVCTPIDSGLKPTGKSCGHECAEAADCCELPLLEQGATGASSCADLADLVANIANCDTATGTNGVICLAYSAYCDEQCGKNTWACEAGACVYTAKCTKATQVVGGCPAYTRGGNAIPACDVKAGKCAPPAVAVAGCAKDVDCDKGLTVVDYPADTCSPGECTCHAATGGCYRKCSEDLDCKVGFRCDADSSLCVPQSACSSNSYCVQQKGDVRAICSEGTCTVPCEHDIDCNPAGLHNGYFEQLCDAGKCVNVGCEANDECGPYAAGTLHSFCAAVAPVAAPGTVSSAITD